MSRRSKKREMIFSFVKIYDTSMVASVRIARYLSEYLDVPIVTDASVAEGQLETLYIVNGAYAFSPVLAELGRAIEIAVRVVWIQNDYTIIPPKDTGDATSPFRRAFVSRREKNALPTAFWSTCEEWSRRPGSSYVNWNVLTFDYGYSPEAIARRRKIASDDMLYYGSYRDGSGKSSRVQLFDRYFSKPVLPTIISSPSPKFAERYHFCQHAGPIKENFYEYLGSKGVGLYIEDRKSSEEFHSPANRFYEMLSAGLPMIFQPECGTMLRRAGYDPTPWQASSSISLRRLHEQREKIGEEQRERWIGERDYREELQVMVDAAIKETRR